MHHSPITTIYPKTEDFPKLPGQQIQGLGESVDLWLKYAFWEVTILALSSVERKV